MDDEQESCVKSRVRFSEDGLEAEGEPSAKKGRQEAMASSCARTSAPAVAAGNSSGDFVRPLANTRAVVDDDDAPVWKRRLRQKTPSVVLIVMEVCEDMPTQHEPEEQWIYDWHGHAAQEAEAMRNELTSLTSFGVYEEVSASSVPKTVKVIGKTVVLKRKDSGKTGSQGVCSRFQTMWWEEGYLRANPFDIRLRLLVVRAALRGP